MRDLSLPTVRQLFARIFYHNYYSDIMPAFDFFINSFQSRPSFVLWDRGVEIT